MGSVASKYWDSAITGIRAKDVVIEADHLLLLLDYEHNITSIKILMKILHLFLSLIDCAINESLICAVITFGQIHEIKIRKSSRR